MQRPAAAVHTFDAPVPEFALTRVAGEDVSTTAGARALAGPSWASATLEGPAIVVITNGSVQLRSGEGADVELAAGDVVWSPVGPPLSVAGPGEAFVATVAR